MAASWRARRFAPSPRELRLRAQLLYTWLDHYEQGSADALVPRGRPRKAVAWGPAASYPVQPSSKKPGLAAMPVGVGARLAADGARAQGRRTGAGAPFFQKSLAARQGTTPPERRAWRQGVFALIHAMMPPQGPLPIERMCVLSGVSRGSYYRQWRTAPRDEETASGTRSNGWPSRTGSTAIGA